MALRALARVNLAAIERNVARLRSELAAGTGLCAVVKGNGYGHGAVPAAQAARAAGARNFAVATASEALELREAGLSEGVLVMGAISSEELPDALAAGAEVVAWTPEFVHRLERAVALRSDHDPGPLGVHVKFDTGMGRLGTREPAQALDVAERVAASAGSLRLAGAMTHFATAGEEPGFVAVQLERFEPFVARLRARWPKLIVHAANSAATLTEPRSHFDLVRCGIAIYGCDPMNRDAASRGLEPALELTSYVAAVKPAGPGDTVGYGRTFAASRATWIATVPIGYADGIRRSFGGTCDVLIGGRRYPIVGAVSMDNITVDLGEQTPVTVGARVTIIGQEAGQSLTAEELASRIGTINYEVVCGISGRVPRSYHRDGEPV